VWAIDRRSQALEDTTVFRQAVAGEISPQQMFDHYLGWLTNGARRPITTSSPTRPARLRA
jgi:hypothetical protein